MSSIRSLIRILAVSAALTMAVGAAAGPAHASIGSVQAKLTVSPYKPGYHNVAVFGKVPMTRTEAQGLIDSGHRVTMKLWGEDTFSDDLLMGPYNATYFATDAGLEFHKVRLGIPDSVLNEDWGGDELYVGVRVQTPTGGTLRSGETNRQYGSF